MVKVSVIVPTHNKEKTIRRIVAEVKSTLRGHTADYEIIISEDGSTDRTFEVISKLSAKDKRVRVLHSDKRLGKGRALKKGFEKARGKHLLFIDADYLGVAKFIPDMLSKLKKADIAVGTRYTSNKGGGRLLTRWMFSKGYIFLTNLLLNINVSDTQCGFKGFNADVKKLLKKTHSMGYFWDTEFLVRAKRQGLRIVEVPIVWRESPDSTSLNPIKMSFEFMGSIIKLKLELLR